MCIESAIGAIHIIIIIIIIVIIIVTETLHQLPRHGITYFSSLLSPPVIPFCCLRRIWWSGGTVLRR